MHTQELFKKQRERERCGVVSKQSKAKQSNKGKKKKQKKKNKKKNKVATTFLFKINVRTGWLCWLFPFLSPKTAAAAAAVLLLITNPLSPPFVLLVLVLVVVVVVVDIRDTKGKQMACSVWVGINPPPLPSFLTVAAAAHRPSPPAATSAAKVENPVRLTEMI
ncbi:hypothetical protein K504DRAFT_454428 [Pleomassaria siparia CBS 279.74]|uniref:Uncharacterized protein n=1 Tax=Pleomassaria siparia CBS 279.74 TaxID=1314801 RepID=A0A6G1KCB4_9PLEO|nr:hypothetical protein K504DRAFT_454428 [Pleomassaria siparia CBS 279.74]